MGPQIDYIIFHTFLWKVEGCLWINCICILTLRETFHYVFKKVLVGDYDYMITCYYWPYLTSSVNMTVQTIPLAY